MCPCCQEAQSFLPGPSALSLNGLKCLINSKEAGLLQMLFRELGNPLRRWARLSAAASTPGWHENLLSHQPLNPSDVSGMPTLVQQEFIPHSEVQGQTVSRLSGMPVSSSSPPRVHLQIPSLIAGASTDVVGAHLPQSAPCFLVTYVYSYVYHLVTYTPSIG